MAYCGVELTVLAGVLSADGGSAGAAVDLQEENSAAFLQRTFSLENGLAMKQNLVVGGFSWGQPSQICFQMILGNFLFIIWN